MYGDKFFILLLGSLQIIKHLRKLVFDVLWNVIRCYEKKKKGDDKFDKRQFDVI